MDNFLDDKLFDNKHFRRLIDGARRLNPITKVRPLYNPVTPLRDDCEPHRRPELRNRLPGSFAGFLRLGEFTYKTEDLNTRSISATKLTLSDIRFSSSLDHVQLTLKRSKTDRHHEGIQIVLAKTRDEACPVDALQKLLLLDPKGPDAPLFSFHRKPFRKGASQHAQDSGIIDDQIQVLGRWDLGGIQGVFHHERVSLYKLNHQFQTGSPAPLSLLLPPPSPPPS
ncbi:hypothetical protein N7532_001377 [Penicillium argentinense]|uniref:Uncharacterized protein n=1 Tax=Penicillium argentinense TaxID=1131581 RepID=A0A9W9G3Y9_9EURO|nr:uncharacterized protein N7532_001377 [Penicillium argentinense]KAJ5110842.1 hypothetical protein N7532_001377 [Penicillium argentinense]